MSPRTNDDDATMAASTAAPGEAGAAAAPGGESAPGDSPASRSADRSVDTPADDPTHRAVDGRAGGPTDPAVDRTVGGASPQVGAVSRTAVEAGPAAAATPATATTATGRRRDGPPSPMLPQEVLDRLVGGAHHDPHSVLGAHPAGRWTIVRALRPEAVAVTVLVGDQRHETQKLHDGGVFAAVLPGGEVPDYWLAVSYRDGTFVSDDPYRYLPTLGPVDLHLVAEGRHERLWTVLGSHARRYPGIGGEITGVSFAVWAPNARGIRVVGDFNFWDGRAFPMRSLGGSGVWELFVPNVGPGTRYKYDILGVDSTWRQKADPLARATEHPPATATVVTESDYTWHDDDWLTRRVSTPWHAAPVSIYEVHLGSWRQELSYAELADELVAYVKDMGFTHVELLPVAEHPFGGSWGYQVSAYYAPTARYGSPDEFRLFVDRLHQAGVGVIVDWVPAHFPRDDWALGRFDGTPLYEHADPRRGEQPDWGTFVFDFGRREVRNFLVANALYWFEEFHVDGLRVDAVASMLYLDYSRPQGGWTPNQYGGRENLDAVAFLQETNATVYKRFPGAMMVAEESTAWPGVTRPTYLGGLGFGFKWNMGWMHDTLHYVSREPVFRSYHHNEMTFSMMYAYSENFILPLSHDEVVHGKRSLLRKMPGDRWQQLANLRALLAYMWAHPGKQLLFMGGEFGQEAEWSEGRSLDWWLLENPDHHALSQLVRDLNRVYRQTPALWSQDSEPAGFSWIDANDSDDNTFSFLRWGKDGSVLACVANFAGPPHLGYQLGLPFPGFWREVVNTDADVYAGSGVGNYGGVQATSEPHHGQPASVVLTLPPLGALWLRHEG